MFIKSHLKKLARKQKDNALLPPDSPAPSPGPPPDYSKAVADFHKENQTKVENEEPLLEESRELTPIEERNAWIAQNICFSGPEHYDLILRALGTPYDTLDKLHAVVHDSRTPPENGQVPFTVAEKQLITDLELGGATNELAVWTVSCIMEALMGDWAPTYWAKQGYCCLEMVWRTSMGRYGVADVAPCAVHDRSSHEISSSSETVNTEDGLRTTESVNTMKSVSVHPPESLGQDEVLIPVLTESGDVEESRIIGVRTEDSGFVI